MHNMGALEHLTSHGIYSKHYHLTLVRLAGQVTLETIFVSALLLAHLAVPSQLLQALGFDAICNLHTKKVFRYSQHLNIQSQQNVKPSFSPPWESKNRSFPSDAIKGPSNAHNKMFQTKALVGSKLR